MAPPRRNSHILRGHPQLSNLTLPQAANPSTPVRHLPFRPNEPSPATPTPAPRNTGRTAEQLALANALYMQMMQRARANQDIITLDEMRWMAANNPAEYLRRYRQICSPSFVEMLEQLAAAEDATSSNNNSTSEPEVNDELVESVNQLLRVREETDAAPDRSRMGSPAITQMPAPQNVYLCPTIDWARYHIIPGPVRNVENRVDELHRGGRIEIGSQEGLE